MYGVQPQNDVQIVEFDIKLHSDLIEQVILVVCFNIF